YTGEHRRNDPFLDAVCSQDVLARVARARWGSRDEAGHPKATGAIFMARTEEDFYRSSNGDRWLLVDDTVSGRSFVRHEPNLSSGGRITDTEVDEFLNRTGSSPENLALRALLDKRSSTDGR